MSQVFANPNSEFYNTLKMYRNYLGYTKPYTFRRWLRLPDNQKAAALYCQFYNEITLAWFKVNTKWSIEAEGVSQIIKYLTKNVEKIEKDKKRFDPKYIYKVAWNCFYCVCVDPSKNKERYYNETSSTFTTGEDEIDWFDCVGEVEDKEANEEFSILQRFFESLNQPTQVYLEYVQGHITTSQAARNWKKLNVIDGNVRDKEYVEKIVAEKCKEFQTALQTILLTYAGQNKFKRVKINLKKFQNRY